MYIVEVFCKASCTQYRDLDLIRKYFNCCVIVYIQIWTINGKQIMLTSDEVKYLEDQIYSCECHAFIKDLHYSC